MNEMTEHEVDRTGWKAGPWDAEPDKLVWKTAAGLPGMIVRNNMGGLCGYVAVAPDHPLHGKNYRDIEGDIAVHGGLTFANGCAGPICHVPEPGEPDDVWWFGFDCLHMGDHYPAETRFENSEIPGLKKLAGLLSHRDRGTYRDVSYVRAEVESLAAQLRPDSLYCLEASAALSPPTMPAAEPKRHTCGLYEGHQSGLSKADCDACCEGGRPNG